MPKAKVIHPRKLYAHAPPVSGSLQRHPVAGILQHNGVIVKQAVGQRQELPLHQRERAIRAVQKTVIGEAHPPGTAGAPNRRR